MMPFNFPWLAYVPRRSLGNQFRWHILFNLPFLSAPLFPSSRISLCHILFTSIFSSFLYRWLSLFSFPLYLSSCLFTILILPFSFPLPLSFFLSLSLYLPFSFPLSLFPFLLLSSFLLSFIMLSAGLHAAFDLQGFECICRKLFSAVRHLAYDRVALLLHAAWCMPVLNVAKSFPPIYPNLRQLPTNDRCRVFRMLWDARNKTKNTNSNSDPLLRKIVYRQE